MRKIPAYLKGLAETRARAHGYWLRLKKIHDEVAQKLREAEALMASCDRLIRTFDNRLDPTLVEPIKAYKGRYGKHGALTEAVKRYIHGGAHLDTITTAELAWLVQMEFGLDFETWQAKKRWQDNSLRTGIKRLLDAGAIERDHDLANGPTGEVGCWRWKSHAPFHGITCGSRRRIPVCQFDMPMILINCRYHCGFRLGPSRMLFVHNLS